MTDADLDARLETAKEAAWRAGRITLRYFQTPLEVETKADSSPVTIADRESEAFLREFLGRAYPDDGFLGEEGGETPGSSGFRWVLDPIDGTKTFTQGVPLYGVMVGLEDPDGEPVVGAVCVPPLDDLVAAARGRGCTWNGRRARVSEVDRLDRACVVYTGYDAVVLGDASAAMAKVEQSVRLVRGWGDCYGHLLVATGRVEAALDPSMHRWDCVALAPIVAEAGGVFTDWSGGDSMTSAVSTNAALADELRSLL